MAKLVECGKFKVIECHFLEMMSIGSCGICDFCAKSPEKGYYIAVLNSWFCPECYEKWKIRAKWYEEDADYEQRNFGLYSRLLGVAP